MKKYISIIFSLIILFSFTYAPVNAAVAYLKVHFIDVGQGDSCFIELPDKKTMLIDAGESKYGETVSSYITSLGYKTVNYVIATHAHADHIGGLPTVFNNLVVKSCYASATTSSTKTYTNFTNAVKSEGISLKHPSNGDYIYNQTNFKIKILNPVKGQKYSDVNDSSIVMKMSYYTNDFLLTGDCSVDILNDVATSNTEVLKVSHHGSYTGTDSSLIKKLNPKYAVISVGQGNSYGHPHKSTIDCLKGVTTYMTKDNGNVTAVCNNEKLSFSCAKSVPINNRVTVGKPTLKVYAMKKAAKLKWSKVNGVKAYKVYMATKKSGKYKLIKTTSKRYYIKKKLKGSKKYWFKVRAYKVVNSKKYFGKFSKIKYVKVKK